MQSAAFFLRQKFSQKVSWKKEVDKRRLINNDNKQ